jgi:hypothetical protein
MLDIQVGDVPIRVYGRDYWFTKEFPRYRERMPVAFEARAFQVGTRDNPYITRCVIDHIVENGL